MSCQVNRCGPAPRQFWFKLLTKDIDVSEEIVESIRIVPTGSYRRPHLSDYCVMANQDVSDGSVTMVEKRKKHMRGLTIGLRVPATRHTSVSQLAKQS